MARFAVVAAIVTLLAVTAAVQAPGAALIPALKMALLPAPPTRSLATAPMPVATSPTATSPSPMVPPPTPPTDAPDANAPSTLAPSVVTSTASAPTGAPVSSSAFTTTDAPIVGMEEEMGKKKEGQCRKIELTCGSHVQEADKKRDGVARFEFSKFPVARSRYAK
ncbi:Os03g0624900 [Oryza sativa Japonica Group]|uniref:Os03g0624900 protein n=2 Tax=Oryza sativa subsp. japonica TaxID=39947 RepID=Q75LG5_ORYSJ|nr:hypothetical protein [Oryza sativa Japonica Group]ABF97698.1 hypothetical protein LOC_Os03g42654 [Oryza sativa Japonica Group]KAB8092673.1 hypothetical protein EE612_019011 [Oryza sativa]BAS85335.1 Os03g0624900 [Oryza sativa Japonica Group]